jgi:hypothetical protein
MRRSAQSAEDFHLPSLLNTALRERSALSTFRRTIETDCPQEPEAVSLGDLELNDPSGNPVELFIVSEDQASKIQPEGSSTPPIGPPPP